MKGFTRSYQGSSYRDSTVFLRINLINDSTFLQNNLDKFVSWAKTLGSLHCIYPRQKPI